MNVDQPDAQHTGDVSRRVIVRGAAWSVPVIALAAAAPATAAGSTPPPNPALTSGFGIGWYPTTANQTANGAMQLDADSLDAKYLRVSDTRSGDVISNIYFQVLIQSGWPQVTFTALPGSNPSWSTLAATGSTTVVSGVTYRIYESSYTGSVIATGTTTEIPVDFYFRASTRYYANQQAQTRRYATVNSTPLSRIPGFASISNTNVVLANAPTP